MVSLAHIKLDFYDDPTIIKDLKHIPDFVRKTSFLTKTATEKLSSDNFALIFITGDGGIHKRYPVHTAGHTWLSFKAFEKNAHKLPIQLQEVAAKYIFKAARSWKIDLGSEKLEKVARQNNSIKSNVVELTSDPEYFTEDIRTTTKKYAASLENLGDEWFGLVIPETGQKFYPLHTKENIKKASAWFEENCANIKPAYRKSFADKLIKAATQQNVVVETGLVFKYAGETYSSSLPLSIQLRKHFVLDETQLHLLDDLLEKSASINPKHCAQALELIDTKLGLHKYWGREFPDPYASVFAIEKIADYSYSNGNDSVSGKELRDFSKEKSFREKLQAYIAKDIIDELERDPIEVFDSLPRPEKQLIMDLMKE